VEIKKRGKELIDDRYIEFVLMDTVRVHEERTVAIKRMKQNCVKECLQLKIQIL
jgi:hypothetical protein